MAMHSGAKNSNRDLNMNSNSKNKNVVVGKQQKPVPKFPRVFLLWCTVKTAWQQTVSMISIMFIMQSGFFTPAPYNAAVWPREHLIQLLLPQAIFEMIDLVFETWITLKVQKGGSHLPWDSILHHFATGGYYFYIWAMSDSLTTSFLGLPVAGLSCQIIGVCYTLHRLRYKLKYIGLALLTVQLVYRIPLAVTSVLRAITHYEEAPFVHLIICCILATLDYRWTQFAFKLHKRLMKRAKQEKIERQQMAEKETELKNITASFSSQTLTKRLI